MGDELVVSKATKALLAAQLFTVSFGVLGARTPKQNQVAERVTWGIQGVGIVLFFIFSGFFLKDDSGCGDKAATVVISLVMIFLVIDLLCLMICELLKHKSKQGTEKEDEKRRYEPRSHVGSTEYYANFLRQPIYQKMQETIEVLGSFSKYFIFLGTFVGVFGLLFLVEMVFFLVSSVNLAGRREFAAICGTRDGSSKALMMTVLVIYIIAVVLGCVSRIIKTILRFRELPSLLKSITTSVYLIAHAFLWLLLTGMWIWLFALLIPLWTSGKTDSAVIVSLASFSPMLLVFFMDYEIYNVESNDVSIDGRDVLPNIEEGS